MMELRRSGKVEGRFVLRLADEARSMLEPIAEGTEHLIDVTRIWCDEENAVHGTG